ncbi:alginate O-acetyltransferase AlgX-related protein [Xanthobacter oligotrophicus]|uniref:alginate O-acetyltransferase AlgX-related protein n=1 Tax=Xanthobacter oligotrophicus TaxID=2607286 RepID=UPI0011F1A687|nr:hypothetical protein [Xanthobacter oligotrophicus]MCG5236223.1 hypothetical protein [Xanthobacter oligotrophicus]
MPLLMSFRRWWAAIFVGILLLPALGHFLPDVPAPMRTVLAPEARWWEDAARRLDPYINNTFGFRGAVLGANRSYVRFIGDSQSNRVVEGEHGTLFLNEDKALEQSIGQLVRQDAVRKTADFLEHLSHTVTAMGGSFAVVVAPNGHTTNAKDLPAYARRLIRTPTEYDLMAEALRHRGVTFVDVRPIFAEAQKTGPVHLRYDTHWNHRGALLAFNAVMAAVGRPDLEADPVDALEPAELIYSGDLQRISGRREPTVPDVQYPPKGPMVLPPALEPLPGMILPSPTTDIYLPPGFKNRAYRSGHAGPRILVLGDSFTFDPWLALMLSRASDYVWAHHAACRFDTGVLERFRPDIVIYAPTERAMLCQGWKK